MTRAEKIKSTNQKILKLERKFDRLDVQHEKTFLKIGKLENLEEKQSVALDELDDLLEALYDRQVTLELS